MKIEFALFFLINRFGDQIQIAQVSIQKKWYCEEYFLTNLLTLGYWLRTHCILVVAVSSLIPLSSMRQRVTTLQLDHLFEVHVKCIL